MSWTTPASLYAQVERLWKRGNLLRALVTDTHAMTWPHLLKLRVPNAADLSNRFQAVRDWVQAIAGTPQIRSNGGNGSTASKGHNRFLQPSIWTPCKTR